VGLTHDGWVYYRTYHNVIYTGLDQDDSVTYMHVNINEVKDIR
jgi:hypothetical protein